MMSCNQMVSKSLREKERRAEEKSKIDELRKFVCEDENEVRTMNQADVLAKTVELVYRMESESAGTANMPERRGFFKGFNTVEKKTIDFIKNLGVDPLVCGEFIKTAKVQFDKERQSLCQVQGYDSLPKPSSQKPSRKSNSGSSSPSTSSSSPSEAQSIKERKEIKKNREQDRRDKQAEAIESLKQFLISINWKEQSTSQEQRNVEKMRRRNTLENILDYISKKKANFAFKATEDQGMYRHAFNGGFDIAKRVGMDFFKNDKHLQFRAAALEEHLNSKKSHPDEAQPDVSPQSTSPTIPHVPSLPIPSVTGFLSFQFFPLIFPPLIQPSPIIDLNQFPISLIDSCTPPSSKSDTEIDVVTTSPIIKNSLKRTLSSPHINPKPPKFWRPW